MIDKAPISVCIIVKNEPLLEDCINSIKNYVNEIVIVDTGSTDNTAEVARRLADVFEIYTDCNNPETGLIEDFSKARQRSFELATQPWVMWVDADDIIVGAENLLRLITDAKANLNSNIDAIAFLFPYEYSYNEIGQCTCLHYRERLVSNKNKFHWVNPVHEVLANNDNVNCFYVTEESIVYKHKRQYSNKISESGRNLRILKNYIAKVGDSDARQLYYYGLECYNNNLIDEAIHNLSKYVNVSGWDDERAMACLKLVDIYQSISQYNEGLKWGFKTIEIKETWGEGYFALARMFYFLASQGGPNEMRNWERCVYFSRIGLNLPITKTLLFINPLDREYDIHRYLNMALGKLGDVNGALESVNIGLKSKPNDQSLIVNKKIYEIWLLKQSAFSAIDKLIALEEITPQVADLIKAFINKEPQNLKTFVEKNNNESTNPTISIINNNKLNIIFFAGDGVETWTPETVKRTGIGGSETMLIEQAKRLAALGHDVSVYNSCGIFGSKVYDGVHYYQTNKFQNLECDVLVVSRRADMLGDQYNITAKLKLLWVHDVYAIAATNELLLKADRILALTEWHKQNLIQVHNIHPDHIIVTRNGIDLNLFTKNVIRNKFKCINSSSPDRSWPILLSVWPEIKKQVPQAELHLYYGFKNWEFSARHDKLQSDLIVRIKNQIKELEPLGVVYHDRVSKEVLAEEFLSAGCWIHPTWFTETSCITAMEAQAAGLGIVTSSIAALNETVSNRGILIDGDWTSIEYQNKFIQSVVYLINNYNDLDRLKLQQYANQNFGLDSLSQNWNNMFYQLINEVKINPIIPYQPTTPYRNIKLLESEPEIKNHKSSRTFSSSSKMKIGLIANHSFPVPCKTHHGGDIVIANLAQALDEMGHEVTLYAPDGSYCPPHGKQLAMPCSYGQCPPSSEDCEQECFNTHRESLMNQDIVHDFSTSKIIIKNLYNLGKKSVISTIMGGAWTFPDPTYNLVAWSQSHRDRVIRGATDYEGTPTPNLAGANGYPVKEVRVVNGGINTDWYTPTYNKKNFLLWMNSWHPVKGYKIAIEIAKKTGLELVMSGEHPDNKIFEYQKQCALEAVELAKGFKNIKFEWLPPDPNHHTAKRELYRQAKALLYTVQFCEPFGLSQAEALACGTPIIGINYGSVSEVIQDGVTGYVRKNNLEELSNAISMIDNIKPEICREQAVRRFDIKVMAKNYLTQYEYIINGGSW